MNPLARRGAQALAAIRAELLEHFLERDTAIEALICALAAGQHVLLIGPPGTAKSELAHAVCTRIRAADGTPARYFQWLLTRFTTPEELFGPVSLKGLQDDRYERVTAQKLPEAHVAFLDEVFKGSSAILNTLLSLMNERIFHSGRDRNTVPLLALVGATNELPEEDELLALSDRFLLRVEVGYLKEDFRFMRLLGLPKTIKQEATIGLDELGALRDELETIAVPDRVLRAIAEIRRRCHARGVIASDRRYRLALGPLRARALLDGRVAVGEEDLMLLASILWSEPEEKMEVEAAIREVVSGHEELAEQLLFQAREVKSFGAEESQGEAKRLEALTKLADILRRFDEILAEAEAQGRSTDRVLTIRDEIRALTRHLVSEDQ